MMNWFREKTTAEIKPRPLSLHEMSRKQFEQEMAEINAQIDHKFWLYQAGYMIRFDATPSIPFPE